MEVVSFAIVTVLNLKLNVIPNYCSKHTAVGAQLWTIVELNGIIYHILSMIIP